MEDKIKITETAEPETETAQEATGDAGNESEHKVQWYIIHTYSGYENKVKLDIERMAQQKGWWGSLICELCVPEETYTVADTGRKRGSSERRTDASDSQDEAEPKSRRVKAGRVLKTRKKYPGYVLIKMSINEQTWYYVRNTRGVTGFLGSGNTPVPLSEDDLKFMLGEQVAEIHHEVKFEVGDTVRLVEGEVFSGVTDPGKIIAIDADNDLITVDLPMMMGKRVKLEVSSRKLIKI